MQGWKFLADAPVVQKKVSIIYTRMFQKLTKIFYREELQKSNSAGTYPKGAYLRHFIRS